MMEGPVSLLLTPNSWLVWHYRVGTWKMWTCIEAQIGRGSISVQKTTEQRVVERPKRRCELFQKILATAFDQGSQKQCSCIDSCSWWNTMEVQWTCISGWLDFNLLATDLLSLGRISYQIWRPPVQKQLHMLHDVVSNMKLDKLTLQELQQLLQDKDHMSMYLGQMNMHWRHSGNSTQTEEHNRDWLFP